MSNDNSGALFANDKREKDTHPTHTGTATIDGVDYWVSAWVKEKNGRKYFSMSYKQKDIQGGRQAPAMKANKASYKAQQPDDMDGIPF